MAFSKWDKVREVKFKEDYYNGTKKLFAKGSTHYMSIGIVEKLQGEGVELEVKEYNRKAGIANAKKRLGIK